MQSQLGLASYNGLVGYTSLVSRRFATGLQQLI